MTPAPTLQPLPDSPLSPVLLYCRGRAMTPEQCANRLTAFLASSPRSGKTRAYLRTMPKRAPIKVDPADYVPQEDAKAIALRVIQQARDASRYAEWEARGKPPSPSCAPKPKRRLRPSAAELVENRSLIERMAEAQQGLCILCGTALHMHRQDDFEANDPRRATFDHVVPLSLRGENVGNRLIAHRKCNGAKGNRPPVGCELVWLAAVNAAIGIPTSGRPGKPNP